MTYGSNIAARFLMLAVQSNSSSRATDGRTHFKSTQMINMMMMLQLPIYHITLFPRSVAPILPTPHSQTATPSPLISGMQSMQANPAPPVGSPSPYPFSHVRRNNAYSTYPIHPAPSSNYASNHPSAIEEQLALQMQMYALNNHAALSDSTFSPSSTTFPGPGYNPWTFLQASRAF
jgi:hypothetical protein